jgi:hypothetical protein
LPLHLPAFGVFGALSFKTWPPNDPSHPFTSAEVLCMSSTYVPPKLEIIVSGFTNGDGGTYGGFGASFSDGDSDRLSVSDGLGASSWDVYVAQYACDDTCATTLTGEAGEAFVDGHDGGLSTMNHVSLDRASYQISWNYAWDTSTIGAGCTPDMYQIDGMVGELLLYDTYLDPAMRDKVRSYLRVRWVP